MDGKEIWEETVRQMLEDSAVADEGVLYAQGEIERFLAENKSREYLNNHYVYAARYAFDRPTASAHNVVEILLFEFYGIPTTIIRAIYKESLKAQYNQDDWQRFRDFVDEEANK